MAEVTINSKKLTVQGNVRRQFYNVTGNNTNTLTTGLRTILQVNVEPVATNPPTVSSSGGTVTFASGGAFTAGVEVVGT